MTELQIGTVVVNYLSVALICLSMYIVYKKIIYYSIWAHACSLTPYYSLLLLLFIKVKWVVMHSCARYIEFVSFCEFDEHDVGIIPAVCFFNNHSWSQYNFIKLFLFIVVMVCKLSHFQFLFTFNMILPLNHIDKCKMVFEKGVWVFKSRKIWNKMNTQIYRYVF